MLQVQKLTVSSADQMADLGRCLAENLGAGDTVLLAGEIGAGKTHLARTIIQTLLEAPEDVPSPTFTLVQVYETPKFEIWHADLYRLTDPDEGVELGLDAALHTAVCLIEWPDRLPELTDLPNALWIDIAQSSDPDARQLTLRANSAKGQAILDATLSEFQNGA